MKCNCNCKFNGYYDFIICQDSDPVCFGSSTDNQLNQGSKLKILLERT